MFPLVIRVFFSTFLSFSIVAQANIITPNMLESILLPYKFANIIPSYRTSPDYGIDVHPYQKGIFKPIEAGTEIPADVLLFTEQRIEGVKSKIAEDPAAWNAMISKISHYFDKVPYNAGEYAGAFAAAYYISGDDKYIERAIELLNHAYFSEPQIGWQYYTNRNLFRSHARWATMGYSWIKRFISADEQERIEDILKLWSDYWLTHVDYENDFQGLRVADTDDVTSITKNITLLGYVLSNSTKYSEFGDELLAVGDYLLNTYVVDYYMNDIMAGGAWAEGSDYSPATQIHWIETFLINKDQRGIPFPNNYATLAMESLLHQTLAGDTGVYKYGSEERAIDYDDLDDDYRYEFALKLMAILEKPRDKELIQNWFNKILQEKGFAKGSMVTNLERLMFYDSAIMAVEPSGVLPTFHQAEGVGLVASRTNWGDTATNLYFINRKIRVDQEHRDALSFDLAYQGKWITKENTGYAGFSETSTAHNTLLIENASADGSSSPTRRPAGDPVTHLVTDDDNATLISASATDVYNMSGYWATNYAKNVNRQIAFIKPSTVLVYDHVNTDKTKIRDLVGYKKIDTNNTQEHIRWVKVIQHVQNEPAAIINEHNAYQVVSEENKLAYQVLWPSDASVTVINEQELWADAIEYDMPENQRKWHFQVSNKEPKENNEFITSLNFGQNTATNNYVLDTQILTKENGYIVEGDVIGVAFWLNNSPHIVLFNRNPEILSFPLDIKYPSGFDNAVINCVGFTPE